MNYNTIKTIIMGVLVLCATPIVAVACSFSEDADRMKPASENIGKYNIVFIAQVINKEEKNSYEGIVYNFDIKKTYKGEVKTGETQISTPGHSCGSFFEVGTIGLFLFQDSIPSSIDETLPRYYFDSIEDAYLFSDKLFNENAPPKVEVRKPMEKPAGVFDFGITNGQILNSPFTFKGKTDGTKEWGAFEGQVGYVELKNQTGASIATAPIQVIGEWMVPGPHEFSVWFEYVTEDEYGEIIFHNDNVSGLGRDIEFAVPVRFNQGTIIAPSTQPGEDFQEPTSPPPYDNSIPKEQSDKEKRGFLEKISLFLGGILDWIKSWLVAILF